MQRLQEVGERRVEVQADGRPVEQLGDVRPQPARIPWWGLTVPPHPPDEPLGHTALRLNRLEEVAVRQAQGLAAHPLAHRPGRAVFHCPVPEDARQDVLPHRPRHVPVCARLLLEGTHLRLHKVAQGEPTSRLRTPAIRTPTRGHPTLPAGGARIPHVRAWRGEVLQGRHDSQVLERVVREHDRVPRTGHNVLLERDVRRDLVDLVGPAHVHPLLVEHLLARRRDPLVQLRRVPEQLAQRLKVVRVHGHRVPGPELRAAGRGHVSPEALHKRAGPRELAGLHLDAAGPRVLVDRRGVARQVVRIVHQRLVGLGNQVLDLRGLHPAAGVLLAVLHDGTRHLVAEDRVRRRRFLVVESAVAPDHALLLKVVDRTARDPQDLVPVCLEPPRLLEDVVLAVQLHLHGKPHPVRAVQHLLQPVLLDELVQPDDVAHQRTALHVHVLDVNARVQRRVAAHLGLRVHDLERPHLAGLPLLERVLRVVLRPRHHLVLEDRAIRGHLDFNVVAAFREGILELLEVLLGADVQPLLVDLAVLVLPRREDLVPRRLHARHVLVGRLLVEPR